MPENTPATQQWTKDTMFRSNYATLGGLILMTAAATGFYFSLNSHLNTIDRRLNGIVYGDDLDRFSVQLELRNQKLQLMVPTASEVMRRQYGTQTEPPLPVLPITPR